MSQRSFKFFRDVYIQGVFNHSTKYHLKQIVSQPPCVKLGQPTGDTHPHLMKTNEITPGISRNEYAQRRSSLIKMLKDTHFGRSPTEKHVIIICGSPVYHMAPDIPYPFRQNANFSYLTGFQEPDTVLVLETGIQNKTTDYNSVLFTKPKDKSREMWDGPRTGINEAVNHFGFDEAYPIKQLGHILKKRYNDEEINIWYDHLEPVHLFLNKEITDVLFNTSDFRFSRIHKIGHIIEGLRVVKSSSEISLLGKCCSITSKANKEVMYRTKPGISESYLHSLMDHQCRILGANHLSFPPVVASGTMANTLHYINNDLILKDGQLVLVDSGCEYYGYCSDVTRVWPVNGQFSQPQRELYEMLLYIQKTCIKICQVGNTIQQVYNGMLELMGTEFEAFGLIPKGLLPHKKQEYVRRLCPHHVSHYLGMDVHDTSTVSKDLAFIPGMAITVEPGIYIKENNPDVPIRFHGIGMRIEDDILITEKGPLVLSSECPKEVDEIEKTMNER